MIWVIFFSDFQILFFIKRNYKRHCSSEVTLMGGNSVVRDGVAKPEIGFLKDFALLLFSFSTSFCVCPKQSLNCVLGSPYFRCQGL